MIISKKNLYKFIYILIFLPFLARFLTDNYGVSYVFMPIFDLLAIVLLILSYYLISHRNNKIHML